MAGDSRARLEQLLTLCQGPSKTFLHTVCSWWQQQQQLLAMCAVEDEAMLLNDGEDDELVLAAAAHVLQREYNMDPDFYRVQGRPRFFEVLLHRFAPIASQRQLALPLYDRFYNKRWLKEFRVSREVFLDIILPAIEHKLHRQTSPVVGGIPPLSPGEQLALFMYWAAHGGTFKNAGDAFGRSVSSVHRSVVDVSRAVCEVLAPHYISLPKTVEELRRVAARFETLAAQQDRAGRGVPQIIGAIDGTHIPITNPPGAGDEYRNRKGSFSIQMQAMCDDRGCFTDLCIGWSGRVHDARVFANSPLGEALLPPEQRTTDELSYLPELMAAGAVSINNIRVPLMVAADSAYPPSDFTLTPFNELETRGRPDRTEFNWRHAVTRNPIERAFGRLKQRFRVLLAPMDLHIQNTVAVAAACCVLHNICEVHGLSVPEEDDDYMELYANYTRRYPCMEDEVDEDGSSRGRRAAPRGHRNTCTPREALVWYINQA